MSITRSRWPDGWVKPEGGLHCRVRGPLAEVHPRQHVLDVSDLIGGRSRVSGGGRSTFYAARGFTIQRVLCDNGSCLMRWAGSA